MRRPLNALVVSTALLAGCSATQLRNAGDKMVRVERAAQGASDGVVAFKDATIETCRDQRLETEAERANCVEAAVQLVKVAQPLVQGVRAALISFWELYPVLEAKLVNGEKLSADDLAELADRASRVAAEYGKLLKAIKDARK